MLKQYCRLWLKFKRKPFTFQQAKQELKETNININVIFSRLAKESWIEITKDPKDKRVKQYHLLKDPSAVITAVALK